MTARTLTRPEEEGENQVGWRALQVCCCIGAIQEIGLFTVQFCCDDCILPLSLIQFWDWSYKLFCWENWELLRYENLPCKVCFTPNYFQYWINKPLLIFD